jgi:hypothetical protein
VRDRRAVPRLKRSGPDHLITTIATFPELPESEEARAGLENSTMRRLFNLRAMSVIALCTFMASASAQTTQFRFEPAKVPSGKVLHYKKSQIDGSRPTQVSVYVRDQERLESLKWDENATTATLVQARMDWPRFSVREFRSLHLEKGLPPELRGTLEANSNGTELKVSFVENKTITIRRWPWHSYDFDFASLGLTLPHLRNPEADVIFWRTDVVFAGEVIDFAEVGGIRLHFEANEARDAQQLRRYSIGGAGFEHRYGKLWTDASSGLLVEYRIPIGDEPGYKNVHLRLDRVETMSPAQWETFKRAKLGQRDETLSSRTQRASK